MRTSLDFEEKKAFEGIAADQQDRTSSSHGNGDKDAAEETHDEERQDAQSLAGSQLPPPPDGGLHAWLKVFGGFLVYINIWSVMRYASCAPF